MQIVDHVRRLFRRAPPPPPTARWRTHDSAQRRRQPRDGIGEIIEALTVGERTLCLGPVVSRTPGDPANPPPWYFIGCSAESGEFFSVLIGAENEANAAALRNSVWARLIQHRPALIVHEFDDEAAMIRWSEGLWPGPKTRAIRAAIESERRRN